MEVSGESTIRDGVGEFAPPAGFRRHIKVLNDDEIARLIEAYQSGKTVYELGRKFGIHRTTVGIILRRHGVSTVRRALAEDQRAEVARLRGEGWSYARLGERFGVHATTVRSFLLRG